MTNTKLFLGANSLAGFPSCVKSISKEEPYALMDSDEFSVVKLPDSGRYTIELEMNADELNRVQEALKTIERSPENEIRHEINTMREFFQSEGNDVSEKIDNCLENRMKRANEKVKTKCIGEKDRYKIKHK